MLKINKIRRIRKAQQGLSVPTNQRWKDQIISSTVPIINNPFLDMEWGDTSSNNIFGNIFSKEGLNNFFSKKNLNFLGKQFLNSGIPNTGLDMINNQLFNSTNYSDLSKGIYQGANLVGNTIGGPTGLLIKGGSTLLTGVDKMLGKKSKEFNADNQILANTNGGYDGTVNFIQKTAQNAGKRYSLTNGSARREQNRNADKASNFQTILGRIQNINFDQAAMASNNLPSINYFNSINGDYQPHLAYINKKGGKLESVENIEFSPIEDFEPIIELYKDGGTLESSQKNVIPEGALHARKHHMENDKNITKKGIPVIDNDNQQQAEIELNEIIFNYDTTKKLEKLYSEYYQEDTKNQRKEELAIEAGKLLVYEILHNTNDRTGLIKECKEGGTLNVS